MKTGGEPELVEKLECRGMDHVAAEVPLEVAVGLEQRHRDAGARQQQRHDHAGRAAADDRHRRRHRRGG